MSSTFKTKLKANVYLRFIVIETHTIAHVAIMGISAARVPILPSDLAGQENITSIHLAEALQYRPQVL